MKYKKNILAVALCLSVALSGCSLNIKGKDNKSKHDDEEEETLIEVSSVEEFLDAIKPGAEIVFDEGVYDLTPDLIDVFYDDYKKFSQKHNYIEINSLGSGEGVELVIKDIDGLRISGKKNKDIELQAEPRAADVIKFENCENITINNMTMGHTPDKGQCIGDVLEFDACENIELNEVDLYGCGAYGINATDTENLVVNDSIIRDCSYGMIWYTGCSDAEFNSCDIYGIDGYGIVDVSETVVTFDKCIFEKNNCEYGFVSEEYNNKVYFNACSFDENESIALGYGCYGEKFGVEFDSKCSFAKQNESTQTSVSVESDDIIDTAGELLEAMDNGGDICLEDGLYNLSEYIDTVDYFDWNETHEHIKIYEAYDGSFRYIYVTEMQDLNLYSRSSSPDNCEIVVTDPRSEVFVFTDSSGIMITGITMGHQLDTDYDCDGDVLEFDYCDDVWLYDLDLYGCGVYGIKSNFSGSMHVYDTHIHDCEYGPAAFNRAIGDSYFVGCIFDNSEGGFYFSPSRTKVYFENCTFDDYETTSVVYTHFAVLKNCELGQTLYQPENGIGPVEDMEEYFAPVTMTDLFYDFDYYGDYETYWEGLQRNDGEDITFYPDGDDSGYAYAYLVLTGDGTGILEGFTDDITCYEWEIAGDDSCLNIWATDGSYSGQIYFYNSEEYRPDFCKVVIEDTVIWLHYSY